MLRVGFFTVFRKDPQHFLHAQGLVESIHRTMPGVDIYQFTDESTAVVGGATVCRRLPHGPMLERRLEHYRDAVALGGDWLLLDTDCSVLRDVRDVFDNPLFDVSLTDRVWPGIPQGDDIMFTMPYNTGVVFCRDPRFWTDVLAVWRAYDEKQKDWMSEQRAVWQVVKTGKHHVQILPGQVYNYPPRTKDDACADVAIAHYKGPRKPWLSEKITTSWSILPQEPALQAASTPLPVIDITPVASQPIAAATSALPSPSSPPPVVGSSRRRVVRK